MRYIIYGAGAVGGTIGARLHLARKDVVFVARGAHLLTMREQGLRFNAPDGSQRLQVRTAGNAAEVGFREGDVVILGVKSQDTIGALEAIRDAGGSHLPILCAQNGVANERMALRRFARVYATVVMLPASHLEPGAIRCESGPTTGILDTGCYPIGVDQLCEHVCADFESATFSAKPDAKVMRQKYRKLLMNLNNAVGAICAPSAAANEISRRARQEADEVYAAAGIDSASDEEFAARRGNHIQLRTVEGEARGGSSSWQSLARGTGSIEADHLNGEIVLLGRLHGVRTPVNALLQDEAVRHAREHRAPASLDAGVLLSRLAAG